MGCLYEAGRKNKKENKNKRRFDSVKNINSQGREKGRIKTKYKNRRIKSGLAKKFLGDKSQIKGKLAIGKKIRIKICKI